MLQNARYCTLPCVYSIVVYTLCCKISLKSSRVTTAAAAAAAIAF